MLGKYAAGSKNVDGNKLVPDSFFLECEAHGAHIDAVGCAIQDWLFSERHHASRLMNYSVLKPEMLYHDVPQKNAISAE